MKVRLVQVLLWGPSLFLDAYNISVEKGSIDRAITNPWHKLEAKSECISEKMVSKERCSRTAETMGVLVARSGIEARGNGGDDHSNDLLEGSWSSS